MSRLTECFKKLQPASVDEKLQNCSGVGGTQHATAHADDKTHLVVMMLMAPVCIVTANRTITRMMVIRSSRKEKKRRERQRESESESERDRERDPPAPQRSGKQFSAINNLCM